MCEDNQDNVNQNKPRLVYHGRLFMQKPRDILQRYCRSVSSFYLPLNSILSVGDIRYFEVVFIVVEQPEHCFTGL